MFPFVFSMCPMPRWQGGPITDGYRNNVSVMPFDDQSVFLASYGGGGFGQKGYWHYFTASALLMRDQIHSQDRNETMIWDRVPGFSTEVTVAGLPERLPNSEVKMTPSAEEWIDRLGLQPHPEGGFFERPTEIRIWSIPTVAHGRQQPTFTFCCAMESALICIRSYLQKDGTFMLALH